MFLGNIVFHYFGTRDNFVPGEGGVLGFGFLCRVHVSLFLLRTVSYGPGTVQTAGMVGWAGGEGGDSVCCSFVLRVEIFCTGLACGMAVSISSTPVIV